MPAVLKMRCTSLIVDRGERRGCMRELGHTGDHHYVAGLFAGPPCDACGHPVTETGRFRHTDCPPPAAVHAHIDRIRHELEQRRADRLPA